MEIKDRKGKKKKRLYVTVSRRTSYVFRATFYFDVNVARRNDVNLACYNDDVEHSVNLISLRVTGAGVVRSRSDDFTDRKQKKKKKKEKQQKRRFESYSLSLSVSSNW